MTEDFQVAPIRHSSKVTSLEDLQKRLKRKINFQDKYTGSDLSIGNLLLELATKNGNLHVKNFFLKNGLTLPQQEQVATVANEKEEQNTPDVKENGFDRSSRPTATVSPISTNGDNRNHTNEIPKVTTPNVEENKPEPSGNVDGEPVPPVVLTNTSATTMLSGNKPHGFIGPQFYRPNEEETGYKESKENFHTSLRNDVVGVVITGLFIAAAVMVPSIAGAAVCGIVAALALVATGIHIKDSIANQKKVSPKG